MRGTVVEALHDPAAKACIMSEFLMDTSLGNMPLVPFDKLLESPSGLIYECRGIARVVSIKIDKIEVHLEFHIYAMLEFDLLIGYPLERLHLEDSSQGSLDKKLRKSASTTTSSCLENPIAKPLSEQNLLEKVMSVSPFVSFEPILIKGIELPVCKVDDLKELHLCEAERPSSPSIELCPSGPRNVVFDSGLETTPVFHDQSLEKEKFCAMDIPDISTLEDEKNSTSEHESFCFEFPQNSCSHMKSPESISLGIPCLYKDHDHLLVLISKIFRRMVVDAFVYHKHCKFCGCTVALTLQLKQ
uniref:Uncharacterized protein n=1 Tax=Setaria viridis TaxID=4556 RepID=A0A4U6VQR4_SETVI|nr:hypothetical protein SEVIR_2G154200v2 [Setaria viridis]